jgi:hypothetical protein
LEIEKLRQEDRVRYELEIAALRKSAREDLAVEREKTRAAQEETKIVQGEKQAALEEVAVVREHLDRERGSREEEVKKEVKKELVKSEVQRRSEWDLELKEKQKLEREERERKEAQSAVPCYDGAFGRILWGAHCARLQATNLCYFLWAFSKVGRNSMAIYSQLLLLSRQRS